MISFGGSAEIKWLLHIYKFNCKLIWHSLSCWEAKGTKDDIFLKIRVRIESHKHVTDTGWLCRKLEQRQGCLLIMFWKLCEQSMVISLTGGNSELRVDLVWNLSEGTLIWEHYIIGKWTSFWMQDACGHTWLMGRAWLQYLFCFWHPWLH